MNIDTDWYQREGHDLNGLHPAVHYVDHGRADGMSPHPPIPRPRPHLEFKGEAVAQHVVEAFTFRPPETSRNPNPIGKRVDIIMPTFNRRKIIGVAVKSALSQTYENHRLIVVDDGSTDGTVDYLRSEFEEELSSGRITVLEVPHGGVCAARNAGLAATDADWVAYLDSDNEWMPDHLSRHLSALETMGANWSFGPLTSDEEPWNYDRFDLLQRSHIDLNTLVHRADILAWSGGFDSRLRRLVDYDLALRLGRFGPPARIDEATVIYKVSSDSISIQRAFLPARDRIRLKHICERTSWGLCRPIIHPVGPAMHEAIAKLSEAGIVELSTDREKADFCLVTANGPTDTRLGHRMIVGNPSSQATLDLGDTLVTAIAPKQVAPGDLTALDLDHLSRCQTAS